LDNDDGAGEGAGIGVGDARCKTGPPSGDKKLELNLN